MMRGMVTLLVAAMMLAVPATIAQEGEEGEQPAEPENEGLTEFDHGVFMTDAEDDVATEAGTTPGVMESPTAVDLISLAAFEVEDKMSFLLEIKNIDDEHPDNQFSSTLTIYFNYGENLYRISTRSLPVSQGPQQYYVYGPVEMVDPETGEWLYMDNAEIYNDPTTDIITFDVSKSTIRDETGAMLIPGRQLTDFYVEAWMQENVESISEVEEVSSIGPIHTDRMPDEGTDGELLPQIGIKQTGHAYLASSRSIRDSNGEESTFVFDMVAENQGDQSDIFTLEVIDVPDDWEVRLASTQVSIDAGESLAVPVVVRTPFSHEHGYVTTFMVEMTSLADPSAVGRIELGLNFLEIPMPAGHHSGVYLHTVGSNAVTMNTLSDDKTDSLQAVAASGCPPYGYPANEDPQVRHLCWRALLRPALSMGLDFDLSRQGDITISVSSQFPIDGAVLDGRFTVTSNQEGVEDLVAAVIEPSSPVNIGAGGSGTFTSVITPQAEADLIPFVPGSNLELVLHVTGQGSSPPSTYVTATAGDPHAARLLPGGEMMLPLIDYSDPVSELFAGTGFVRMEAEVQEIQVNPGETGIFEAMAYNDGESGDKYRITIDGMNAGWARLLGPDTIDVSAGGSRPVSLAVAVPADASDGDRADIILEAVSSKSEQSRSLVRLVATVDEDVDHTDMALDADLIAESNQDSPGLPVLPLSLLLAGLAVALRRRK